MRDDLPAMKAPADSSTFHWGQSLSGNLPFDIEVIQKECYKELLTF